VNEKNNLKSTSPNKIHEIKPSFYSRPKHLIKSSDLIPQINNQISLKNTLFMHSKITPLQKLIKPYEFYCLVIKPLCFENRKSPESSHFIFLLLELNFPFIKVN
jgi:hypothetical protein